MIFVLTLVTLGVNLARRGTIGGEAASAIQGLVFAIPAALIVARQPRNTIGWLLMFPAVALTLGELIGSYLQSASAVHPTLAFLLLAWFSGWSWVL
jgi:hypothetical protein